jgi:DNA modification methylase
MTPARKPSVYRDGTDRWRLIEGDALEVLAKKLPDRSVDAVVVDPPYNCRLRATIGTAKPSTKRSALRESG